MTHRWLVATLLVLAGGVALTAAELQPRTVAAFDRYVSATESQLKAGPFLRVDALPAARRTEALALMRRGELWIEAPKTLDGGKAIDVHGGLIHHWVGTAFVSGATIDQTLLVLQDYNRHERIYAPTVAKSKLESRDGDRYRFFLRFMMKKVITVVINSEHEAFFARGPDRAEGWIHSTRIAEVANPDTPTESELPVGNDGGYMWRLNTYWRLLARDGGLYIQCESVSLTRGIPTGFGWIVGPFVTSIDPVKGSLVVRRKQEGRSRVIWHSDRPTLTASPGTYGECEAVSGGQRPRRIRHRSITGANGVPASHCTPIRGLKRSPTSKDRRVVQNFHQSVSGGFSPESSVRYSSASK